MNSIKKNDDSAMRRAPISTGRAKKDSDGLGSTRRRGQRTTAGSAKTVARLVATSALLLSPCVQAQAGLFKPDVDYSNYDVPLYDQVVNRIKAKVAARLGEGKNTVDRYFIVPFAYQDRGNRPARAHSFISVIRVFADNKQPHLIPGLREGKFKNREFEAFTISWMPADFATNQDLCVFDAV